jgi:hypothetical protein
LPEAVSIAWFAIVLLIVRDAPVLIVRLLHTGVKEALMRGWLAGADGMVTLSLAVGAPTGDQLPAVLQLVLLAPVHVFWANAPVDNSIMPMLSRVNKFFIIFWVLHFQLSDWSDSSAFYSAGCLT